MPLRVLNRIYREKDDLGEYFYRPHRFSKKTTPPPKGEPRTCYWCGLAETAPIHGGMSLKKAMGESPPVLPFPRKGPPLNFTERVLGWPATGNMKSKGVYQTVRSDKETQGHMVGDVSEVRLDGKPMGLVQIDSIERINLGKLTAQDSLRGGFGGRLEDLRYALHRAGYRYKDLKDYEANLIKFHWLVAEKVPSETLEGVQYKKPAVPITQEDVRKQNETLSGGYGLDRFVSNEPEKPKEPAPLTHLKVGDIVYIEIGDWRELGDYAKVIAVDGEQVTVEGIEPKRQGRKAFNETHFLTFSMGWGDHPGGSEKYPGEWYFFHFAMVPPDDVLAFGLRRYEEATGNDEFRKYYNLFNYFAPEAEFKPKARDFDEALLRHHFYSPHGVDIEELFHGVKPLPKKAWELGA